MAANTTLSLIIKTVDKATEPLRDINKRMADLTKPVRKFNNSFKALATEAGFPRVTKSIGHVGKAFGEVGKEVRELGGRLFEMAFGSGVAGFALFEMAKGAMEAGDQLNTAAERVGLGVDTYAQLRYAAGQADVEQEEFNTAMDQFNKRMGEMRAGGGPLLEFLTKVNPAFAEQFKHVKNTEEGLSLMTAAFEKIKDPGKRAALSAAAFGKSSLQMGVFLSQGSEEISKQRQRYLELAGSQKELAEGADAMERATKQLDTAFEGTRNAVMVKLFPAFTSIAKWLADFLAKNREGLAAWAEKTGKAIQDWVDGGGMERLVEKLGQIKDMVLGAIDAIGGIKGVALVAALVLGAPLLSALGSLTMAFITLGTAIGFTPIGWFLAAVAGIAAAAFLIIKYWEPIKKFFVDLWDTVADAFQRFWRAAKPVLNPFDDRGMAAYFGPQAPVTAPVGGAGAVMNGGRSSASITVDFKHLPRGSQVATETSGPAQIDVTRGYSMLPSHG